MVFVNDPFMYSFVMWALTMAGAFLLFGNLQNHDPDAAKAGERYSRSYRWLFFVAIQLILLVPAGMYLNENRMTISGLTASSAKNLLSYQANRNNLMYIKFAAAFVVLVVTQIYKRGAKNTPEVLKKSILDPKCEVQGYEQMSVHFNSRIAHYFNPDAKLLTEAVVSSFLALDFFLSFAVILHMYVFSDVGVSSTWIQWWEYTTALCGMFVIVFTLLMRLGKYFDQSQSIFYSPESAVGHDHPSANASKKDGNAGLYTLRVLNVKIPPFAIIVYSLVEIGFGFVFFNDFGNVLLWTLILVIFPHMMTAMVRTHSAWFQFHAFALVAYGNAFFFMPAVNVMRNSAGSHNRFIPGSTVVATVLTLNQDTDRHLMMLQEYNNTDQMYRTSWTSDYALTALSQSTVAVYTVCFGFLAVLSGLGSLERLSNRTGGFVQRPSGAEMKYFAPIHGVQKGVLSQVTADPYL